MRILLTALAFSLLAAPAVAGWVDLGKVPTPWADTSSYSYALGADGTAAAAWCLEDGSKVRVQVSVREPGSSKFGKVKSFITTGHPLLLSGCAKVGVAVGSDGAVHLVFTRGDLEILAATRPAGKSTWGPPVTATKGANLLGFSGFDIGPDGTFWLLWTSTVGQAYYIHVARRPKGGTFSVDTFSGTIYLPPSLNVAGDGGVSLLEGIGTGLRVRGRWKQPGQPWGQQADVSGPCVAPCQAISVSLVSDAPDGHAALYLQYRSSNGSNTIHLVERLPGQGFGAPQTVVSASSSVIPNHVSVGNGGAIYLGYSQGVTKRLWSRKPGQSPSDTVSKIFPQVFGDGWLVLAQLILDPAGSFVRGTVRSPAAKKAKETRLSSDAEPAIFQKLVYDRAGKAIAFWTEGEPGDQVLKAALHTP